MPGPATPALLVLRRAGVPHVVREYDADAPPGDAPPGDAASRGRGRRREGRHEYGAEAARALGIAPERIFKSLVASVDGRLTIAIVPVSGTLDMKRLADATGGRRAEMAEPVLAERATGYVVGGISPLGGRRSLPAVLDESALAHATICVSAGRRGLQVELDPADLVRLTGAVVAPIAR